MQRGRNFHVRQVFAIRKGIFADLRDAFRNFDPFQRTEIIERIGGDRFERIGKFHFLHGGDNFAVSVRDRGKTVERIGSERLSVRDHDRFFFGDLRERISKQFVFRRIQATVFRIERAVLRRHAERRKVFQPAECVGVDHLNVLRYGDRSQSASVEGVSADPRQLFGESDAFERGTIGKRACGDLKKFFRQNDRMQIRASVEHARIERRYVRQIDRFETASRKYVIGKRGKIHAESDGS